MHTLDIICIFPWSQCCLLDKQLEKLVLRISSELQTLETAEEVSCSCDAPHECSEFHNHAQNARARNQSEVYRIIWRATLSCKHGG